VSLDAGDPLAIGSSWPSFSAPREAGPESSPYHVRDRRAGNMAIDRWSTSLLVGPGQMRTLTIPVFIK